MKKYFLPTLILTVIVVLFGIFLKNPIIKNVNEVVSTTTPAVILPQVHLKIGSTEFQIEIASTEAEQEAGLSGRTELEEGNGLWFPLATANIQGIWMENMLFPIDIVWFDEKMRVIDVKESATPESYPEIFYPQTKASFVLEIPAGFWKKINGQIGDTAVLLEF